jgi:hypothetical protein
MSHFGHYSLYLKCDTEDDEWHGDEGSTDVVYGLNRTDTLTVARNEGWTFRKTGHCFCPKCTQDQRTQIPRGEK